MHARRQTSPALAPRAACAGLLLLGCAACASAPPGQDRELAHALRERGFDPAMVVVPWQVSDEMRRWVHEKVPDGLAVQDRLTRLLQALLGAPEEDPGAVGSKSGGGLGLRYETGTTPTGEEAFAGRRANCLGFTSLFVGLARELGVPVFYLEIGDVEKFAREGGMVVESGHVTAGYGSGDLLRILEFTQLPPARYRNPHRLSDLTAIALFHSNRGAEMLEAGRNQEAVDWLRRATRLDPGLAGASINLGVALRRSGDPAGAEAAYRRALEADPGSVAAYQNLAALLYAGGRPHEAAALMALSARLDTRNPFNYLALGDVALDSGRIDEARRFYRKAQRLAGADVDAMAALGEAALAAGDRRDARRWLRKAEAHDPRNERVVRLAARLGGGAPDRVAAPAQPPSSPLPRATLVSRRGGGSPEEWR